MWKLFRAEDVLPIDYLLDIHSILFSLNNYTGLYNFNILLAFTMAIKSPIL